MEQKRLLRQEVLNLNALAQVQSESVQLWLPGSCHRRLSWHSRPRPWDERSFLAPKEPLKHEISPDRAASTRLELSSAKRCQLQRVTVTRDSLERRLGSS